MLPLLSMPGVAVLRWICLCGGPAVAVSAVPCRCLATYPAVILFTTRHCHPTHPTLTPMPRRHCFHSSPPLPAPDNLSPPAPCACWPPFFFLSSFLPPLPALQVKKRDIMNLQNREETGFTWQSMIEAGHIE